MYTKLVLREIQSKTHKKILSGMLRRKQQKQPKHPVQLYFVHVFVYMDKCTCTHFKSS